MYQFVLYSQLGKWTCEVTLNGVSEFQRAAINAIDSPRVEDVRIPLELTPQEYTVSLTPDFDNIETLEDGTIRVG